MENWKNKFDSVMCFIKVTNCENLKPKDFITDKNGVHGKWKVRFAIYG